MSPETITWVWFVSGLLLIGTELFLPGLVVSFLGLAAILVAALRWLGLISGIVPSFTAWFVSSIVLLLGLRHLVLKWLPADTSFQTTDEDIEAIGQIVDVVKEVSSGNDQGRIRFAGTTWPAVTKKGVILAGGKARLLYRDNLVWTVEPHSELESSSDHELSNERN
jgi:membrane protein implicated in regulation of membrane protease activity